MPANVYVTPKDKPTEREWFVEATGSDEAEEFVAHIDPQLPDGLKATWKWDTKPDDCPTFDIGRLVEKPKEWGEE